MDTLKVEPIVLRKLTIEDAEIFDNIYTRPDLFWKININDEIGNETAEEFTKRMLWLCKYIYTIRLRNEPEKVIGCCVLYNWNKKKKDIFFGGSLLPEYWGKGIMPTAFNQMVEMAKYCLGASFIKICINEDNQPATRMVEKLGFFNALKEADFVTYTRPIDIPASTAKLIHKDKGFQQAI
ncbi:GNAT family N-acetyltransferase [Olivibacter sp. CPCC 100613]|uniref:GNAT family N-acetyltransferase n=1 Tax=Olivibacter sp. CPCC 100613 TaxID=3079931 RepID=UPI002FF53BD1